MDFAENSFVDCPLSLPTFAEKTFTDRHKRVNFESFFIPQKFPTMSDNVFLLTRYWLRCMLNGVKSCSGGEMPCRGLKNLADALILVRL